MFEVPDMYPNEPPARVRFRLDAPVPAVVELLALDRLREFSGVPFDPATTRGTVTAQVNLGIPLRPDLPKGSTAYNIAVDVNNFSAEKMMFNQRVEAQTLRVTATNQNYQIKGDVKIGGTPAQVEYRRVMSEPEAEVRLQATLDDAARARLGLNFGTAITGLLSFKLAGRVSDTETSRLNVEADLTPLKVDSLLPGWVKPRGQPGARDVHLRQGQDGDAVRRSPDRRTGHPRARHGRTRRQRRHAVRELPGVRHLRRRQGDAEGGSRARRRDARHDARRRLRRPHLREVVDGRSAGDPKNKPRQTDIDLDIKIGVVAGHYGEALRGLDLRMSRRNGRVRSFSLNAKIGRDTALIGDMRTPRRQRPSGALFRDQRRRRAVPLHRRLSAHGRRQDLGGDGSADPGRRAAGRADQSARLRRSAAKARSNAWSSNAPERGPGTAVEFARPAPSSPARPGAPMIRDGVVRGPLIGATMEGLIDYARDEVNVRGTLVPLYGLNNMFGQIPIVGLFLGGGSNEGLLGITYEVTGPPSNPRADRQSDLGDRAGPAAQVLRVPRHLRPPGGRADAVEFCRG